MEKVGEQPEQEKARVRVAIGWKGFIKKKNNKKAL